MARDLTCPLVTGGAGFIGSALVRRLLDRPEVTRVVVFDKLTYAGSAANLPADDRVKLVRGDVVDGLQIAECIAQEGITGVMHLAAESHVDRSIESAAEFLMSNVIGTGQVLEACRRSRLPMLLCSTDEVYGSIKTPWAFDELSPLQPSSPYSASKAAADLLALAARHTYGQDVVITRCSNNYGPRQHPEKLLPRMVQCALRNEALPVYGDGLQVRDWIHVDDHAAALIAAYLHGAGGEVYNIGAGCERTNLELVGEILRLLDRPVSLIRHVTDRPGHDRRYAVNADKAKRDLGWEPTIAFESGFPRAIREMAAAFGVAG